MTRTCPICGREYEGGYHHQTYCSPDCKKEGRRRTFRAWYAENRAEKRHDTCRTCGKDFEVTLYNRVFCSSACREAYQARKAKAREVVTKTCAFCGTTFETTARYKGIYCSKLCAMRAHRHQSIVTRTCAVCGKEFQTYNSRAVTCSEKCMEIHKNHRDDNLRPHETRTCAWCGKRFDARRDLKTRYCSLSCAQKAYWHGTPEALSAKMRARREEAIARAAEKKAEREATIRRRGGLTDAEAAEVARAQDGDPSRLWQLSQGWTQAQRKYAKERYLEKHNISLTVRHFE